MGIELYWMLQFQKSQVILERGGVVLPMHDHPLHVPADRSLALQVSRNVELAEDGDQRGQESGLTVSGGHDVAGTDEHAAAFVFGEESQPGWFAYEDLPGEFPEFRAFAADDAACFVQWPDSTF